MKRIKKIFREFCVPKMFNQSAVKFGVAMENAKILYEQKTKRSFTHPFTLKKKRNFNRIHTKCVQH